MENNNARKPYHTRKPYNRDNRRQEEFFQRPNMSCLALKVLLSMRKYCNEKKLSTMHYAIFHNYVLATMCGEKVLPKDAIQQMSPTLAQHGYKIIRLDASRYAVLRMPQVDAHWTKLGSKRTASLPNDFRKLSEMLAQENQVQ